MAEIKMDISEYEALKKQVELLEESKKKESSLNETIKKLQKEKMQVLLDAQKSISIVHRNVREETVYLKRSEQDCIKALQLYNKNYGPYGPYCTPDYFIDMFFEKFTTVNDKDVTVATKGLEEVKTMLREELKKEIDSETSSKLKELEYLKNKEKSIEEQLVSINIERTNFKNTQILNDKLEKENKLLKKENIDLCLDNQDFRKYVYNLAYNQSWNILNYLDKNTQLKQVLREHKPTIINKN